MKIGFQGWFLTQPYTGIGQHCLGLLRELATRRSRAELKSIELIIAVPSPVYPKGIPRKWIRVVKAPFWIFHPALKKWWWETVSVPQFFARQKLDWEYYPYPSPLPKRSPHLRAMTVHDLILWHDPRYKGNRLKSVYHRAARRSLVYVDHLFTVSQATHDALGIPVATVLGSGAPELPTKIPKLTYDDALVYLGGYDVRKNVPELVEVFSRVNTPRSGTSFPQLRLLLIGEALHHSRYYPEVPKASNVYSLGTLTDDEVYAVLKSSFAFINFSDSEGFNIPLLQAMLAGTPAIVKDLPVNREVSQDSALFLPDTHVKTSLEHVLSDMIKLLRNPVQRKRVIAAQKKAAARFSWTRSTQVFLKTLSQKKLK